MANNTKVYLEIVKHLREMITIDGLIAGDKIPSERELSERLNFGRSSVREALRALELLGLIETRRGEGTFIRDFRGNHLVQLLSTFILQDEKAKRDVLETRNYIEMDLLRLALQKIDDQHIVNMKDWLNQENSIQDDEFFNRIIEIADNHLLSRIWSILKDYYDSLELVKVNIHREKYLVLLDALAEKNELKTLSAYFNLRNLSVFNDKY
ncbi:FadR/GntR family transcriptional regulator [Neobacillus drentensis]|uniref:FadR/GntR family transcriptional regulator n=1 Tax=Neobacillus drentensis TaxID=220684 RepID=UPI00285C84D9|nr:GntR family transcriptional regulator [Neobacillus drentensis]MDR7237504.1 DNA-binding FadR family transcriptional regulator [Neobacillus drentensis]